MFVIVFKTSKTTLNQGSLTIFQMCISFIPDDGLRISRNVE